MRNKLLAVASLVAGALAAIGASPQRPAISLTPCDVPGVTEKARCGTYEVWENRDAKAGRRISLKVLVLPATGSDRQRDALTFIAGGPGEAATRMAPFLAAEFAAMREHRDMLLVDQRGTGGSHPLDCDLYPERDAQAALGAFFPAERVRACRAVLERDADPRFYTTANAVDDLDDVRGALGYDRLDLFGGSYGTRVALVYLRRHPEHARVAVLQGVAPTTDPIPLNFPKYAQNAIDTVLADCAAEPACQAAFPNLKAELQQIIQKTEAQPVAVEILDPATGDAVRVSLSRNLLGEALRYLMYQSATALLVPSLIHQAAGGDFGPLAEFALFSRRQLVNVQGQGLYLSVTCSEDLPFIKPEEAARIAANTFLGDYRYQQQRAACDVWPAGPIPASFREPVKASTPVLMLSGSWDPVTPPSNADQAAATLPNAVNIVVPAGGHDYDGLQGIECLGAITTRFVDRGGTEPVDRSCIAKIKRPPFPTTPFETKRANLTAAQLAALPGHYVAKGAPNLEITVVEGKVLGRVEGEDPLVLVPVSPTRLRVLGAVGTYVDVEIEDGRASRLTLTRNGVKTLSWTRE